MTNEQGNLLIELKKGSSRAFGQLYKDHYKMIAALVTRMGGASNDAEDVFQEALFVLVKNIQKPDFQLTAKISTYLHAIARNLWLKRTNKNQREISMAGDDLLAIDMGSTDHLEEIKEKEHMIGVVFDKIDLLEDDCKKVIRLTFLKKMSHAEVAEILGYTVSFIKVKKFRCLKYLRGLVAATPVFQN